MIKRGVTLTVLCILLLPLVIAIHNSTITTDYSTVYETNPVNITIDVANDLSSTATINGVEIQNSGFNIQNIIALIDWAVTNNDSIIFSTSTAGISNWGSQKFGISAIANNVDQDMTYDWNIITTDTNSDSTSSVLQLTVLNDDTPPQITATTPGAYTTGNNSEYFSITANDPETGIKDANLHISNCDLTYDNITNTSSVIYTAVSLSCDSGVCSVNEDLTSFDEGDVCFFYDISNNGGESTTTDNLTTIIDRTAPTASLISPDDDVFLNVTNIDLMFNAQDNFDDQLDCDVVVNEDSNLVTGSGNLSYNLDVNDGVYTWMVSCDDEVGLIGNSETRTFTIDNSAPNITIIAPAIVDRGTDAVINVSIIDDGAGVDQSSVTAEITDTNGNLTFVSIDNGQITYATTVSTEPGTYTIRVSAKDNLGQEEIQTAQFRIRESYLIDLNLNQTQIDASTSNDTKYITLTGSIIKDDGTIPSGSINIIEILVNETLSIDNATGAFQTQIQIPEINGGYNIVASYDNGIDIYTANALITVGPYCGNGVIDSGEECDITTEALCSDYGFDSGTTSCTASCTIDQSECRNAAHSSHSGSTGGSGVIVTNNESVIVEEEPQEPSTSGIIETPQQPITEEPKTSGIIETTNDTQIEEPQTTGFGIGAAWSSLIGYAKGLNTGLLLALAIIGILLYVLGWRKKDDDWDSYIKKHGQH